MQLHMGLLVTCNMNARSTVLITNCYVRYHMLAHIFKKKLNEVESSYLEVLLFYYTFNKRCCDQVVKIKVECNDIKHFNVEFVHTAPCKVAKLYFDVCFYAFSHYSALLGIARF